MFVKLLKWERNGYSNKQGKQITNALPIRDMAHVHKLSEASSPLAPTTEKKKNQMIQFNNQLNKYLGKQRKITMGIKYKKHDNIMSSM